MPSNYTFLLLGSVLATAGSQALLKAGVTAALGPNNDASLLTKLYLLSLSPLVVLGLTIYGLAAITWLFVLSKFDLSFAYPFVGLGFLFTAAAAYFFLGEPMPPLRMLGTFLVAAGCILVGVSR